jgi:hypothetical protein
MNEQIKIIDNFLPENEFKNISDMLMNKDFPWYYSDYITRHYENKTNNSFYFIHMFFNNLIANSQIYTHLFPITDRLSMKSIIRAKANLYPNCGELIEHDMHTDYNFEHQAAIFYINTNNGYTKLKDGTKIESIANRVLIFKGNDLHCSTTCTDQQARININFNYF